MNGGGPEPNFPSSRLSSSSKFARPNNQRAAFREKMTEDIANGVQPGWLLDPIERTVAIYRPGHEPQVLTHPGTISGESPVEGFVLDLAGIL
jgi:Uma2 family endonuclease